MRFLLPFFQWADHTWVSDVIRNSKWMFPAIEGIHIMALAVLFGALLLINLRLWNLTMRSQPVARLADELAPWMWTRLAIIVITGSLLFASEAMKCYANGPFQVKMAFLFGAILFHFTWYRRVTHWHDERRPMGVGPATAACSVLLWFGVGWGGRLIGFF